MNHWVPGLARIPEEDNALRCLSLFAHCLLSGSLLNAAHAQHDYRVLPWAEDPPIGGAFAGALSADLNGDGYVDAVYHRGSTALFLPNLGHYDVKIVIASDVNDLAILPPSDPQKNPSLVAATESGVWRYDWGHNEFNWSKSRLIDEVVAAYQVVTDDMDGDGVAETIVVLSDEITVEIWSDFGNESWAVTSVFAMGQTISTLAACDWDNDGAGELAMVLGSGELVITDAVGNQLDQFPGSDREAKLIALQRPDESDQFAWIGSNEMGEQQVTVISSIEYESLALGTSNQIGVASADFDDDLDTDLVVLESHAASAPRIYWNLSEWPIVPVPTFFDGAIQTVDLPSEISFVPGLNAPPIWDDLDNDGDFDLAIPGMTTEESLLVMPGRDIEAATLLPTIDTAVFETGIDGAQLTVTLDLAHGPYRPPWSLSCYGRGAEVSIFPRPLMLPLQNLCPNRSPG